MKWPEAKLVEDKANGPAVIQALRHEVAGLMAITPQGGKVARAQAVSPQAESCDVYLPHPVIASWVESFIDECSGLPNGKYDDQVDQMTQVLSRLRGRHQPREEARLPSSAAAERRPQLDEVSLGTDQPYAAPTARKREIGRGADESSRAAAAVTPEGAGWQEHMR